MPITETLLRVAQEHPSRPAIIGTSEHLSYGELLAQAPATCAVLTSFHESGRIRADHGVPVIAVSVTSAFHTARILASLAGARVISTVIDPRWPESHQVTAVLGTEVGLLVSDSASLAAALRASGWSGRVVTLADVLQAEDTLARMPDDLEALAPQRIGPDDEPFLMLFSSGTTSAPKAFVKTRAQYRANVAVSCAHLDPRPSDLTLAPGPMSYSLTLYAVIEALASGGGVRVADEFSPFDLGSWIADSRVTRIVAVPAVVRSLAHTAARHPEALQSLRLLVTGGAHLSASLRAEVAAVLPEVPLVNYYGAAEIGFIGDSRAGDDGEISVYPEVSVEIRGTDGSRLPPGATGDIWVHAAACSAGYLGAAATQHLRDPDGWATVRDQGRWEDGRLHLVGRAGDIAVTGGHKVALTEVERAFDDMPGSGAVSAVALPHETLGTVIALAVERAGVETGSTDGAGQPSQLDYADWARARLAPQFVPRRWYLRDTLPRTVGGKIKREALVTELSATAAVPW